MAKLQGLVAGVRAVYAVSDVCWALNTQAARRRSVSTYQFQT